MSKNVEGEYKSSDRERIIEEAVRKIEPYLRELKKLGHVIIVGGITENARELLILNGMAVQLEPAESYFPCMSRKYYLHLSGRARLETSLDSDMLFLYVDLPCGCCLEVRYDLIDGIASKLFVEDTCEEHGEYRDGYDVEIW